MKILITGATGFIGQRLVKRLTAKGHEVRGTARTFSGENFAGYNFLPADLTNFGQCEQLTPDIDVVIHCAGKAGVWGRLADYELANVIATQNILTAAEKSKAQRFINISSPSIYFTYADQFDLKETDLPEKFSNAYARTKFQAEQLVQRAHSERFLTVSLRPRGVIGAGDKNWLPRIIEMQKNGSLIQPGYGENLADFTCVENLMDAIELCLTTDPHNMGEVYNITNGKPEKLWLVIADVLKAVGLPTKHRTVFLPLAMFVAQLSQLWHTIKNSKTEPSLLPIKVGVAAYSMTLDITKAQSRLGYKPRQSTAAGLREFCQWYSK